MDSGESELIIYRAGLVGGVGLLLVVEGEGAREIKDLVTNVSPLLLQ